MGQLKIVLYTVVLLQEDNQSSRYPFKPVTGVIFQLHFVSS